MQRTQQLQQTPTQQQQQRQQQQQQQQQQHHTQTAAGQQQQQLPFYPGAIKRGSAALPLFELPKVRPATPPPVPDVDLR
jgi:hypothetical protein